MNKRIKNDALKNNFTHSFLKISSNSFLKQINHRIMPAIVRLSDFRFPPSPLTLSLLSPPSLPPSLLLLLHS